MGKPVRSAAHPALGDSSIYSINYLGCLEFEKCCLFRSKTPVLLLFRQAPSEQAHSWFPVSALLSV